MSLIGPKPGECPSCHRPQPGKNLCSSCARTGSLFEGIEPGHAGRRKAQQFSLFAAPPKERR